MKLALSLAASLAAATIATAVAADPAPASPVANTEATDAQAKGVAAKPERSCFYAENISGYTPLDDRTVNVRVSVREIYQFELMGPCHDINWGHAIGIESRGSNWICAGIDAQLIVPSSIGTRRCAVKSIRKLSPAEIEASKTKPKS